MSDLKTELTEIKGVGPATAEAILDVLAEQGVRESDSPYLDRAKQAAAAGDDRDAAMYLRRATGDN